MLQTLISMRSSDGLQHTCHHHDSGIKAPGTFWKHEEKIIYGQTHKVRGGCGVPRLGGGEAQTCRIKIVPSLQSGSIILTVIADSLGTCALAC